jgi:hypothetical protein
MSLNAEEIAAREILSANGIYGPWYLRPSQLDIYDLLISDKNPFIEASRRFGKTTSIIAFVMEQLQANPGWICRWCEPWKFQARQIVKPIIAKMQRFTPRDRQFKWTTEDSVYKHPNGSLFYLVGVNDDGGESARGPASNIIVADEYGSWKDARYIINDILRPQLQGQEGRWMIRTSTPPPDLDHIFYDEREIAIRKKRYIKKIIYDNEALTEEELLEIIEESGGADSETFRREYLCEDVIEAKMQVLPEYSDTENVVPDDYPRPQFFTPYIAGDSGADDNTALLFGYYDFEKDEIVIEREMIENGMTTKEIIKEGKKIESELWGDVKPHKRVYDAPKQLIYDIFVEYKWGVIMPDKADKTAAVHLLRNQIQSRKFKIKESCTGLRRQMRVGRWKDEKKTDFQRSEGLGHLDAIAAGIYFNRAIDRKLNPRPHNYGYDRETQMINPHAISRGSTEDAIAKLFSAKLKARGRR